MLKYFDVMAACSLGNYMKANIYAYVRVDSISFLQK